MEEETLAKMREIFDVWNVAGLCETCIDNMYAKKVLLEIVGLCEKLIVK